MDKKDKRVSMSISLTQKERDDVFSNDYGVKLLGELFDKYNDENLKHLKVIISGQRINKMAIISYLQDSVSTYEYVNLSSTFGLGNSKEY